MKLLPIYIFLPFQTWGCNDDFSVNWAAQNVPNGRLFRPYNLKKINDLENYIIPQIDYQIMWHIILKLYIQIIFEKVVLLISGW